MRKIAMALLFAGSILTTAAPLLSAGETAFSPYVDEKGAISMPSDFRAAWSHLGTPVVTSAAPTGSGIDRFSPGQGFHDVYTQQASAQAYRKSGTWPDGTMIVMEVRSIQWDDLPTGHVMVQGQPVRWLVMVKDAKGRFPGNANWGDGWGWAAFRPVDMMKNYSTNYKNDCAGCHAVAKDSDRVFTQGYPALR